MRILAGLLVALFGALQSQAPGEADEILAQLSKTRLDKKQIYNIRDITIRRDALSIAFNRGTIAFIEPVAGRVTGAVFIGSGEVVAIPPDSIEKQQLHKFTGSPILNEAFRSAYLRFTDSTYEEILKEYAQHAHEDVSEEDSAQFLPWDKTLSELSGLMNHRLIADFLEPAGRSLFFAELNGDRIGVFDVVVDPRSVEEIAILKVQETSAAAVADVWTSFHQRNEARNPEAVAHENKSAVNVLSYDIDVTLPTPTQITAKTTLHAKGLIDGQRVLTFGLSRSLRISSVSSVSLGAGGAVSFFQQAGSDSVTIVLPRGLRSGEDIMLEFAYAGEMGDRREVWYPFAGDRAATFNLTFHYAPATMLLATGSLVREWEENGLRNSIWTSDGDLSAAAFRAGPFMLASDDAPPFPVHVSMTGDALMDAREITRFFAGAFGAYPYKQLTIVETGRNNPPSWPTLIEIPTGSGSGGNEFVQEIARQWFSNVYPASYHDQWILEGFSRYAAAMYLEYKYPGTRRAVELLNEARSRVVERQSNGTIHDDAGPIWLGQRLANTLTPQGYRMMSNKAAWVLHMLRMLMRQDGPNPDEPFLNMTREFLNTYRGKDVSTWDFKRIAEKYMTKTMDLRGDRKLDWFFDQWVFGTGIPVYTLDYKVEPSGNQFTIEGTIKQSGVPEHFTMPVPVYAGDEFLGRVVAGDDGGEFRFRVMKKPEMVSMDPLPTILRF